MLRDIFINFIFLFFRLFPILLAAVFIAEIARLWLGGEKLRSLLLGSGRWQGRLRAAALGAALPFCECGAFPLFVALLRAGVPLNAALTFFIISPVVSIPAFLLLSGLFSIQVALIYLAVTTVLGFTAASLLGKWAERRDVVKNNLLRGQTGYNTDCCENNAEGEPGCEREKNTQCDVQKTKCCEDGRELNGRIRLSTLLVTGVRETGATLRGLLPIATAAILIAAIIEYAVPEALIETVLGFTAPLDVAIAAGAGIPIYTGDCTMFALVAPFIEVTGAVGPGIAFIIAGAGTSINGLVFMTSIFTKRFMLAFVLSIFSIALAAGYLLGFML